MDVIYVICISVTFLSLSFDGEKTETHSYRNSYGQPDISGCAFAYMCPHLVNSRSGQKLLAFGPTNLNRPGCKWVHICLHLAAHRDTFQLLLICLMIGQKCSDGMPV